MKALVTGASGLLGWEVADAFEAAGYQTVRLMGRQSIDITNTPEIIGFVEKEKPDVIIHCAGFRDLDEIEKNEAQGFALNAFGTKNMALAASRTGSKLVYISSDAVYDGEKKTGYHEYDFPNPVNVYGKSKHMAEEAIRSLCQKYFIIRPAWLFGLKGHRENNVIFSIIDKINAGEQVLASGNQFCSPSYTLDIAEALVKVASTEYYGTYLVSNRGAASRYEVSRSIAEFLGLDGGKVIEAESGKIRLAKRAANTVFESIAFSRTFGIAMAPWKDALERCIAAYKKTGAGN
ncbi:MAG: NAD(P)-dependent oxidoreductase [Spirochaetaceae bacterium]|nr:NAD(P)-dependent oxidoreductase [Spirochaetaceae bacterium]